MARVFRPLCLAIAFAFVGCGAAQGSAPASVDSRCFVVLVHGMHDEDLTMLTEDGRRQAYWQPAGNPTGDFVDVVSRHGACESFVTGYDGAVAYLDRTAAGVVASEIADFVQRRAIPDGRMVLVAHSMGGLVIRWILNHPEVDPSFAVVARATRHAITISTPHLGSPGADVLYDNVIEPCDLVLPRVVRMRGWVAGSAARNRAAEFMQTASLEAASAPHGVMNDGARVARIYTIATTGWHERSMGVRDEDRQLALAWECMRLGDDCPRCTPTPGDGLVTAESAFGRYERSGASTADAWHAGQLFGGPVTPWLRVALNHNHSRYADEVTTIEDLTRGVTSTGVLAAYIAQYGFDLGTAASTPSGGAPTPESTPGQLPALAWSMTGCECGGGATIQIRCAVTNSTPNALEVRVTGSGQTGTVGLGAAGAVGAYVPGGQTTYVTVPAPIQGMFGGHAWIGCVGANSCSCSAAVQ